MLWKGNALTDDSELCGCAICALKIDFAIDTHRIGEIEKHNCVIFAGSGISTETNRTHPSTLYHTLKRHADVDTDLEFWKLVDRFESQPNGRQKFIQLVKDRFSYIDSFRDLYRSATRFHNALGNAPYFKTIITTNWDRYFEDVLEATPFVYDSDIPFWESAKRPVLKIHGSIDNFSSIIASTEDYALCEERLRQGALGAVVKQIFATKTCIFSGYSAKDKDFRRIFQTIQDGLGKFARAHYLVSPYITDNDIVELRDSFGIIAIKTDATHFINTVKIHMREKFCYSSDASFERISEEMVEFREMHYNFVNSYHPRKQPHLIFSTAYQDGVIHAFERIVDRSMTGEFSDLHDVQSRIRGYEAMIEEYKKKKNYWDVSYFRGYQNGLLHFVLINSKGDEVIGDIPECFHPGKGELYMEEFDEIVRPHPHVHKGAFKQAQKMVSKFSEEADVVVQHLPWG